MTREPESVEQLRLRLMDMWDAGATTGELETVMVDAAMVDNSGKEAGIVWSAYLSAERPDKMLERFVFG
jgi:hypothetical protein